MHSTKNTKKVASKQKKNAKRDLYFFLPPLLSLTNLSVVLTGNRARVAKTTSVALLYTYLFKNVLFNGDRDTERWVQISWENLRTILGTDYREVVDLLINTGYLERLEHNEEGVVHKHGRGHYWNSPGKLGECKKYRIPDSLLSPDKLFKVAKEPATTMLTNKVTSLNKPVGAEIEKYREMALFNMNDLVLLDTPACRAVLDELFAQGSVYLPAADFLLSFNHWLFDPPIVCLFGTRAHHRVVRLNKRLRPFLRWRDDPGSPIVEMDFVASQPSLFANINAQLIKKYAPECSDAIPLFAEYGKRGDFQRYQRLCHSGLIYEYLRDKFNKAYGRKLESPVTREDVKGICFKVFFSDYNHCDKAASIRVTEARLSQALLTGTQAQVDAIRATLFKKRGYELFKRRFPSVHALFADIKALDWSSFNPSGKHANNSLLAQRIEAGLIYTRFVAALVKGGITRFSTTHDSVNVKTQDVGKAHKIIEREIRKLGLRLNLKTSTEDTPVPVAVPEALPAEVLEALEATAAPDPDVFWAF